MPLPDAVPARLPAPRGWNSVRSAGTAEALAWTWNISAAWPSIFQPIPHGAPCRLRVETQLGFKMVKYLRSIELVDDYRRLGDGQGGFREDTQFYGQEAGI